MADKSASEKLELQKEINKREEGGWKEFGITVGTVTIFMALFYMYSWQLQIIYATKDKVQRKHAGLKTDPNKPPYCNDAVCMVDGDILDIIMKFFNQTLVDIYNIIVGSVVSRVVEESNKAILSGKKAKEAEDAALVNGEPKQEACQSGGFKGGSATPISSA